jgi:hypothetical protein
VSDFFGALELELHAAAERRPRRQIGLGTIMGALACALLAAAAVLVVAAISSGGGGGDSAQLTGGPKPDPVGTVIPKGEGDPPRSSRSTVVATGTSRAVGPWQMEASRSTQLKDPDSGEVYQPAGLRCLYMFPLGAGREDYGRAAGQCGEFPRTPGFSRLQLSAGIVARDPERNRRLRRLPDLVFGRVPERAAGVVVSAPDSMRLVARPHEGPRSARGDFYAISVPRGHPGARVNWVKNDGSEGSRGIALLPPITRR